MRVTALCLPTLLHVIAVHIAHATYSPHKETQFQTENEQQQEMAEEKKGSIFDKLTDPSLYTGAHKNRFDDSGKGKGIEGRVDRVEADGYVDGFKKTNKTKKTLAKVRSFVQFFFC